MGQGVEPDLATSSLVRATAGVNEATGILASVARTMVRLRPFNRLNAGFNDDVVTLRIVKAVARRAVLVRVTR